MYNEYEKAFSGKQEGDKHLCAENLMEKYCRIDVKEKAVNIEMAKAKYGVKVSPLRLSDLRKSNTILRSSITNGQPLKAIAEEPVFSPVKTPIKYSNTAVFNSLNKENVAPSSLLPS